MLKHSRSSTSTCTQQPPPNALGSTSTYHTIPPFYQTLPRNADSIGQKLREEARTVFLQKRSRELLDNNELKVLWTQLEASYTLPMLNNEKFISYDDYGTLCDLAGPKCRWEIRYKLYFKSNYTNGYP